MDDAIEVQDILASPVAEVIISESRPTGCMGWYRTHPSTTFSLVYPTIDQNSDQYRCPYPLFPTREDVIEAAKRLSYGKGCELRIVRVML